MLRELLTADVTPEPQAKPFGADELVACPDCRRSNAPTRTSCLYCGAALPITSEASATQKPVLRPLEKWERGYNNVRIASAAILTEDALDGLADLLKVAAQDLAKLVSSDLPLPLARTGSSDEALLVQRRLADAGIESVIVSDEQLGPAEDSLTRIRAMSVDELGVNAYQSPETAPVFIPWSEVSLIVTGRITTRRLDIKEQRGRLENQIVDSSEFFDDEVAMDLYMSSNPRTLRITSKTFDFSVLGTKKGFRAEENLKLIVDLFHERAGAARFDSSYDSVRKLLDVVWPPERENESAGWRRDRPGRFTLGSSAVVTNFNQFTRYSRLRFHLINRNNEK